MNLEAESFRWYCITLIITLLCIVDVYEYQIVKMLSICDA